MSTPMKWPFHPIDRQTACAAVAELPRRLASNTEYSYLYRGSEGSSLQAKARCNLRWHQLFHRLNRRAAP